MTDQTERDRIITALYDARRPGLGGMTEAQAVGYMADAVVAALARAHQPAGQAPATDQAALRDRIAQVLVTTSREEWPYTPGQEKWDHHKYGDRPGHNYAISCALCTNDVDRLAAVLASELPAPADRAAVLREAADVLDTLPADASSFDEAEHKYKGGAAAEKLRRMADEAQQPAMPDFDTLAAALDGLHTLIATSSRDWQTYRVDAWLWAVLCGWDCEQAEHDDTCTHGALEETAAMHGWDDATVAKARRYRAAVRILTGPAVEAQQPKES